MGLDITLYRPYSVQNMDKEEFDDLTDYRVVKEGDSLYSKFENFLFEKENEYFDIESKLKELNLKEEDLIWCGEVFNGTTSKILYVVKSDPLYIAYNWLYEENKWTLDFKTKKDLLKSDAFKTYKDLLAKCNLKPRRYKRTYSSGEIKYNLSYEYSKIHKLAERFLLYSDIPTYKQVDKMLAYKEVGYQRKGANAKFYADGMWSSDDVVERSVLENHWKEYFSGEKPYDEDKDIFGLSVEYNNSSEENEERFKRNILDKFVEGIHFVRYH